ncbi:MAG: hypothetical protein ACI8ZW_001953, partial [Yoonia sp.]
MLSDFHRFIPVTFLPDFAVAKSSTRHRREKGNRV